MAELKSHSEPSMEEILASIRRIIAEDDTPQSSTVTAPAAPAPVVTVPPAAPAVAKGAAGYVDTPEFRVAGTDPVIRTFPPVPPSAVPPPPTRVPPVQEAILDLTDRIDHDETGPSRAGGTAPQPAPPLNTGRLNRPPPLKGGTGPQDMSASALGGETSSRASPSIAASVATLTQLASLSHAGRQPELPLGDAGRTLEEMVRELLRPHLKEWLDAHLPRLVERMVRDEINRLIRDAQER